MNAHTIEKAATYVAELARKENLDEATAGRLLHHITACDTCAEIFQTILASRKKIA